MLGALIPMSRCRRTQAGHGVTLVELIVVLAILSVLLAVALPSAREFIARKRLEGVAQELVTDLRLLKSYQIQNRPGNGTSISFSSSSNKVCYMLYMRGNGTFPHCDCGLAADRVCGEASATGKPIAIRQVDIPSTAGITLSASRTQLTVNGYNGLPMFNNTLNITVSGTGVGSIEISNSPLGVPSLCSRSGAFGSIRTCGQ
jgi:prepilin-type N-terminal cleavage/methylation domain-containing protein